MLGRTDSRRRLLFVLLVFVVVAASLELRLGYWQVVRQEELSAKAVRQTATRLVVPTHRGTIYDRTGLVVLAQSVPLDRLAANPRLLTPARRAEVAEKLVTLLALDADAADSLRGQMTSDSQYVVLRHELTPQQSAQIRVMSSGSKPSLSGLVLEPEDVRTYPESGGGPDTNLASLLLGFVNRDGQGQYGVEQFYQSVLAGTPRIATQDRDVAGNPIPDSTTVIDPGSPGRDVTLTIDAALQKTVEQELLAAWIADRAKRVSAIVMDPDTGEIYAYAGYPGYNARNYSAVAEQDPALFVDPIASSLYEPGSVFKLLTATAALGNGTIQLLSKVDDSGSLSLDGGKTVVDDADLKAQGKITFQRGVALSRNVVAAKVALGLAPTTEAASQILYDTWRRLGIGSPTGIDVANEGTGLVTDPAVRPWRQIDLANGSFGQGVAVTPIQLATAYSAMVNGGTLVRPRVVRVVGDTDTVPVATGEAMTPEVSVLLTSLLRNVLTENLTQVRIPGYDVGGKTGTAQIWDPATQSWKQDLFNYSFVGFIGRAPGHPDLVIAVRIEEGTPTTMTQGHIVLPVMSYSLFKRIAQDAMAVPDLLLGQASPPPVASAAP